MKLIDIEPKLEALEKGLDGAMAQIGDLEKRLEQLAQKHNDLVHAHETHTHAELHRHDATGIVIEETAEAETIREAAETVQEAVQEATEEIVEDIDAFTRFAQKQEAETEEASDDDDATFPEESHPEAEVKVEPVPETDDAPPVDDYVEILNKETGKTHRIHRHVLAQLVNPE